ncbi:neutral zinc metallopeptidase [Novosphingobium humi]|uniref:Neutral zinc metallopeptidase n=1 Tax=Novosphingobium humi TaxID=2282397 RepID=A0ABY7TUN6_9SPHN|nr:neutral zinc metallopeptidase [Novosphingobium humi]WCT76060.1 neutral zinc metallopeptidase [Novosphingobium humi]
MRLDDFDPNDVDIEDQRGRGGGLGGGFGFGGGGQGLQLGGGGLGIGTIAVLMIGAWMLGFNPLSVLGLAGGGPVGAPVAQRPVAGGNDAASSCTVDAASRESCNALSSLNKTWRTLFEGRGHTFARPRLVFYSSRGSSGCGAAQSAMGPFYCPADHGIYLDTDFYRQMDTELGATGQFARDYVIAHEYGHHVQSLLGTSAKVQAQQERNPDAANPLSVRLELQADCYAGVWAARNRDRLEKGDMESGLNAAHQIGDDTLMKSAGRTPVEAAFTHGSSAQRMEWLRRGMESGDPAKCDTFGAIKG